MTTNIRNLTPHDIVIFREDGAVTTFYKDPLIPAARVRSYVAAALPAIIVDGRSFQSSIIKYGETENLPELQGYCWLIVSGAVRLANPERKDLISPDTGETAVRDDSGQIVGVKGFLRN